MGAELTSTGKAILGMVWLGTRTGYEIKQRVDRSTRYFWAASYGQIYPELERLEKAGLVAGEDDPQGGRTRRAYSLTEAGELALHDWLVSDDAPIGEVRDETMLKLFFASALTADEVHALLARAIEEHERTLSSLRSIKPAYGLSEDDWPFVVRDLGIALHECSANWYRGLAKRLAEER